MLAFFQTKRIFVLIWVLSWVAGVALLVYSVAGSGFIWQTFLLWFLLWFFATQTCIHAIAQHRHD